MDEAERGKVMIRCRAGGGVMETEAKQGKVIKWGKVMVLAGKGGGDSVWPSGGS